MCVLFRRVLAAFHEWLADDGGKALLVTGSRQVGKSFLTNTFARDNFSRVVAFDLLKQPDARDSFNQATNAADLMLRVSLASDVELVPGQTVVIFDEVQECPSVVSFIKFLVQKYDYRFILSGSLLGTRLRAIPSLPIGYVTELKMYPLDFQEFCQACGVSAEFFDVLQQCLDDLRPVPDFIYDRFIDLWHRYLLVGGMPDAVAHFVETGDMDVVRRIQGNIRQLYAQDIVKYAPDELRLILADIFQLIPAQLSRQNRRFQISDLRDVKRFTQVDQHFLWLEAAGVALSTYNVSAPIFPLLAGVKRNLFKLYSSDVGLLNSAFPKTMLSGILQPNTAINLGGIYENAVAQELHSKGYALRYFSSKKIGELDFLLEDASGQITALEVKSGVSYRTHAALDKALAEPKYTIDRAFVLAETGRGARPNIETQGQVTYLPIFFAALLGS